MKESVTILKLTNGENIIGKIVESEDFFNDTQKTIDISLPLKFMLRPKATENGFAESLSLSPWIHPLTDEEYITINSHNVVMSALASRDLANYYSHCVDQFNIAKESLLHEVDEPTDEELDEIEEEELKEIIKNRKPDKTIH